jgi:hypothetical protein
MNQMPFSIEEIESQMQRENAYYLKAMVGGIAW